MPHLRHLILACFLLFSGVVLSQESAVIRAYINTYKDIAIAEMNRTGVPASIKLAQGIHETLAGTSTLVQKSNNHFGIKCKANWTGESVSHTDDAPNECFRKYPEASQSYRDHSDFLRANARYASLFNLDPTDYRGWAYGLKKAGYATNPKYPQVIIRLVEDYQLQDYTMMALGKLPMPEQQIITVAQPIDLQGPPELETSIEAAANYPSGEFRINDTRVIYVKAGTSYLGIAKQHHVPLKRLFEYNELEESEVAAADHLLFLQRKRKNGDNEYHIMKHGESLKDIAQTEAIRLESLLGYNFLQENMRPAIGEKLYLRGKAPQMPRLAAALAEQTTQLAPGTDLIRHTVAKKETLYAIARKHAVKAEDIMEWNDLQSSNLREGQQLKIYK